MRFLVLAILFALVACSSPPKQNMSGFPLHGGPQGPSGGAIVD